MPPTAKVFQDLSKGSNLVTNPYVIGEQQNVLITNFILDEHGSLHVRDGTVIQTTAPDLRPIVKLFDFITLSGTIYKLAIVQGTAGNNQLYNRGTVGWTLIGTLGTKYGLPDILTFTNLALIANGYETPWSLNSDGVTLIPLVDTPGTGSLVLGAKHHTLHQGYYWVWNTAAATTTYDGPSSLRASDINNPNSWPKANQLFVDKDAGDEGMGMGQFTIAESGISPSTSQILFKAFSAYQMTGVFGSTNPAFAVQRIKSDMGCVAPRTIRFAPGFGLLRLTHRGVALFNGVDDHLVSEEMRPLLFGSDTFQGIDWSRVASCEAEVIANPPMYTLFCPMLNAAGGIVQGLTRAFCYDLVRKAWTVLYYATAVATVQSINDPGVLPVTLIGDFNQGKVRTIFNPVVAAQGNDDGVPITWAALLRPVSAPSPQQRGYFRRVIVKIANVSANFSISWSVLFGPVVTPTAIQKSGAITLPAAVPSTVGFPPGWGLSAWGQQPWGDPLASSIPSPNSEADATIDLGLIATNARMQLTGQGHCTIRGIEWHVFPKPLVRPSVYV